MGCGLGKKSLEGTYKVAEIENCMYGSFSASDVVEAQENYGELCVALDFTSEGYAKLSYVLDEYTGTWEDGDEGLVLRLADFEPDPISVEVVEDSLVLSTEDGSTSMVFVPYIAVEE